METNNQFDEQDIAVVGIALRFPGADNAEQFWQNLESGKESVQFYTDDELSEAGVPSSILRNPNYVKAGAPMNEMEEFDPEFFGFSPKEGGILDPQHRHFYECSWEALEDAGHVPSNFDGQIGVFAGCGMGAYFTFNLVTNPELVNSVGMFLLRHTGNDKDFLSSRVSYSFDLKGPSVNVQTACSTSLVATHLACQSLISGECDMALAGGSTIELPHRVGYLYKDGEILSPDGHCRAFDHRSKGTIFGSGTGVVVLRRMEDAIDAGDRIYAVIKGTAINNDGSSKVGYLAPSVDGQAAAITEALAVANVEADSLDYVECHGTGTPMGDPIEVSALTQAFRETSQRTSYCGIGSVKTNIGHLDTAAGVASLIKVCLALKNKKLPPSLNYEAPNPTIDFANSPFYVNDKLSDWSQADGPRRAGVNSLGVGGTNAFAIVEEFQQNYQPVKPQRTQSILAISARTRKSLENQCERLANYLSDHPVLETADVSYSLLTSRARFEHRRVVSCESLVEAQQLLRSPDPFKVHTYATNSERAPKVFLFPGGGSQYLGMGAGLYHSEPVYREHIDRGMVWFEKNKGIDLAPLLTEQCEEDHSLESRLEIPSIQLPAVFIVEYAITRLWESVGIKPDALIGHSMGENTAACIAGVMSFEDALGLVSLRGELMDSVPAGGMLSVELPADQLKLHIGSDLDLAAENSPSLSVASGSSEALDQLAEKLSLLDIEHQRIKINIAAHSRLLEDILDPFKTYLQGIRLGKPEIPFISNRTGTWITDEQAGSPEYWVEHLRHAVLFAKGIDELLQDKDRVYIEAGPGNILSSLIKQNPSSTAPRVISSFRHASAELTDQSHFCSALGRVWQCGETLDTDALWPQQDRQRVSLPTYAFQHNRYWIEPGNAESSAAESYGDLEKTEDLDKWYYKPAWVQVGLLPRPAEEQFTWLVFIDDTPLGKSLCEKLSRANHRVITVQQGDAYYKINEFEYRLSPEMGAEGYDSLVSDLVTAGTVPNRVLHLWLVTDTETFRPGSSFFHRNQEQGFYSLFFLASSFGNHDIVSSPNQWFVITNGMQQVNNELLPYPDKATVLGPSKVIPREFPNISCKVIDIETGDPKSKIRFKSSDRELQQAQLISLLITEFESENDNQILAYRNGNRWQQLYQQLDPAVFNHQPNNKLKPSGTYLITGGLGGIGFTIAEYLAKQYKANLVLINRTPLPDKEDWETWLKQHSYQDKISKSIRNVMQLEKYGSEVLAIDGDVTNVSRIRHIHELTVDKFGQINGIFHAAGTVRDSLIQAKTQNEIEEVFAPKVYGTQVLDQQFGKEKLDFFLLFSSTSTVVAPMGQVDYVAANAFMNAYAQSRRDSDSCPAKAINWGIWNETGMAANAAAAMGFNSSDTREVDKLDDCRHPLFEKKTSITEDGHQTLLLYTHLSPSLHWILDQHRNLNNDAIAPGTSYFEFARSALAEFENFEAIQFEDVFFFVPLTVEDGTAVKVRVTLKATHQGYEFKLHSERESSDGSTGWLLHAEAQILMKPMAKPISCSVEELGRKFGLTVSEYPHPSIETGQGKHMKFGPRWQVLRQQAYVGNQALAELSLSSEYAEDLEDYPLHPALLDIATGYAMSLIDGYDENSERSSLWVPVSYDRLRYHQKLPEKIISLVSSREGDSVEKAFASFDISIFDTQGAVLIEVESLTIKRMVSGFANANSPESFVLESQHASVQPVNNEVRQLSASEQVFHHNLSQGILPNEGIEAIERVISVIDDANVVVSSLPLDGLSKEAEAISRHSLDSMSSKFSRPELDSEFVEARDDVERSLVGIWEELLGVDQVGIEDSFFDLGGHSLIAVRLFAKIKQVYHIDYPISILFEAPTIEKCGELIKQEIGFGDEETTPKREEQGRFTHLVPMHSGSQQNALPFFLVAGMFGNVLNLRHLAQLIGSDRAFYGLQARGLYGDQTPHVNFEDMARDYIAEIRRIQPNGPYTIGGFSGGGITAYEIARQLMDIGEHVHPVIMLDTPLPQSPPLSSVDRMSIHLQNMKSQGPTYLTKWAKNRYQWELNKFKNRLAEHDTSNSNPFDFKSTEIEIAFRSALDCYDIRPLDIDVQLFRPALDNTYALSGGRVANKDREIVLDDNGWQPYVNNVYVYEVPGDHDSMVLEPNVRVLAEKLREVIAEG